MKGWHIHTQRNLRVSCFPSHSVIDWGQVLEMSEKGKWLLRDSLGGQRVRGTLLGFGVRQGRAIPRARGFWKFVGALGVHVRIHRHLWVICPEARGIKPYLCLQLIKSLDMDTPTRTLCWRLSQGDSPILEHPTGW